MLNYENFNLFVISLIIIAGILLLSFGGDFLARGASGISKSLKINPLIAGLTIVSMATSMPELITSIYSAFLGLSGIAVGNITGSNIANIGLILGTVLLINSTPIKVSKPMIKFDIPFMMVSTMVFSVMCYPFFDAGKDGHLGVIEGLVLLLIMIYYIIYIIKRQLKQKGELAEAQTEESSNEKLPKNILLCLAGTVFLAVGADILVGSCSNLGQRCHISENIIGLTIVAVGTSLPEFAASVAAVFRKEIDICVGNVLGSNIFNILFVGGLTGVICPITIPKDMYFFALPATLIITFVFWKIFQKVKAPSKLSGLCLISLYFAIMIFSVYKFA